MPDVIAYRDAYQGDDGGEEDLPHPRFLVDGRLPPRFERRTVLIPPGRTRGYEESEWRDAIVVVQSGQIELRGAPEADADTDAHEYDHDHDQGGGDEQDRDRDRDRGAGRRRFGRGDILWLDGLPIRALHNPGSEPAVLVAVSRTSRGGPAA